MTKSEKNVSGARKRKRMPHNIALDEGKQTDFNEKVATIKSQIKEGTRELPGYSGTPGVLYVGSIPRGFEEYQMEKFFTQFGSVLKLRMSRSKKTGSSKGYAFVMFEFEEVAKVVADTMNNYLMFQKLLKCRYMPAADVHKSLFKGCNRKFSKPKAHTLAINRHNSDKSEVKLQALAKKTQRKIQMKMDKLAALGVDYSLTVENKEIKGRVKVKTPVETKVDIDEDLDNDDNDAVTLDTPIKQVLLHDSSEDEIVLKTPSSVRVEKAKSIVKAKSKVKAKVKAKVNTKTNTGVNTKVKNVKSIKGRPSPVGTRSKVAKTKGN